MTVHQIEVFVAVPGVSQYIWIGKIFLSGAGVAFPTLHGYFLITGKVSCKRLQMPRVSSILLTLTIHVPDTDGFLTFSYTLDRQPST
jgi:hypothetical protein